MSVHTHFLPRSSKRFSESPAGTIWQEDIAKQGFSTWNVTVAGKKLAAQITPEDLENFANWDTSFVWDRFPSATDVLTLHGLQDQTVSPWVIIQIEKRNKRMTFDCYFSYDALIYARALSSRSPGTHTLHLVEHADHNFTGRRDDVVEAILQWWNMRLVGEARTGIWVDGFRGKL